MDKLGKISSKRFEKFLLAIGCELKSQESSHRKYHKQGLNRPIIVPVSDSLPSFIIANNLRTLGVSKKVFVEMIQRL